MVKCDLCSKEFYKKPSKIKRSKNNFCSKECYDKYIGSVALKCPECGKDFKKGKNSLGKTKTGLVFCSKDCLIKYKKRKAIKSISEKCSNCGKDLIRKEKSKSGQYFCSFDCKKKHNRKKGMVVCVVCKKDFYKPPAEIKRYHVHCCSVECRAKNNLKQETKECEFCGKKMTKPKSLFKDRKNFFCSEDCHNKWQSKKVEVFCEGCGKSIIKSPCYAKRSDYSFCNNRCKGKFWGSSNYVENEFSSLLKDFVKISGITYEKNNRNVVSPLELDFWFPNIKYAVEINGKTHYKPIFGEDSLRRAKCNDKAKKRKCKELGIKLRVVKPGNSRDGTRQRRFERVLLELKQRAKEFGYNV